MFRRRWRRLLWTLIRVPLFLLLGVVGGVSGKPNIDPRKVAIYIRWSTDDQSENTTLEIQRTACRHYALSQGLGEVPDERVFIDDGYSGATLNRPAMARLRELVQKGEIECVIVYKIDRLSRNIVDAVSLVLEEWDGICHLKCVTEPIDTTTELGRVIFSILATFADFERSTIRQRLFSGKVQRAAEGRNPGIRLPFGYKQGSSPGEIVVDEAAAAIVRRIFEMYASGMGTANIAAALNAEGLTGYMGREWSKSTVQKMLRNEAYIGRGIYGRTTKNPRQKGGGPRRVRRDEPLVVVEGAYPVIVDPELFERCRQIRQDRIERLRSTSGRALTSSHLLTGLARCKCGHLLQAWRPSNGSKRARSPQYRCHGRIAKGKAFCDATSISQRVLDDLIVSEVKRLAAADMREAFVNQYVAGIRRQIADLEAQITKVKAELAQLDEQEAAAYGDYRTRKISAEALERLRGDINQDRERLSKGLEQLQIELANAKSAEAETHIVDHTLNLVAQWDNWDIHMKKQILHELISDLVVYRAPGEDQIHVELRFRLLDPEPVVREVAVTRDTVH